MIKLKTKRNITGIIVLGILLCFLPLVTYNIKFTLRSVQTNSNISDTTELENRNLKSAAVSRKIHIDNNWTAVKEAKICTGNGTFSEPYVIEDLVIDGGGRGSCILIENSEVFFKIENCTLSGSSHSGILLLNVTNSHLIDNNCSLNDDGISLFTCNNNTVLGNNVSYNGNSGIFLINSNENNITGNYANNNNRIGISISGSNNTISENTIFENDLSGIRLSGSKNMVSRNVMVKCGLYLRSHGNLSSHNIDITNLVNGNPVYYYVNELHLGSDNFTNAGQVILINCNDSSISNLNTCYGSIGVSLHYCNNNNISGNYANNNTMYGIELKHCDNNTISGNYANNNIEGIFVGGGNNNIISGNTANYNYYGIFVEGGNNNTISGNIVNNNNETGICIGGNSNTMILDNIANNNDIGIGISGSHNTISSNIANNNSIGIGLFYNLLYCTNPPTCIPSYSHVVTRNIANLNDIGIYLYCSDNNSVIGNTLIGNNVCIAEENCQGNTFSDNGACIYGEDGEQPILGYNLLLLLGIFLVVVIILSKRLKNDKDRT